MSSLLIFSSILNVPGESTLRRDFQRLQQENKERSEAHKRQQAQLAAQRRDPEEHKRQLLHDRQKRIEEQKEQRRRLEEVRSTREQYLTLTSHVCAPFLRSGQNDAATCICDTYMKFKPGGGCLPQICVKAGRRGKQLPSPKLKKNGLQTLIKLVLWLFTGDSENNNSQNNNVTLKILHVLVERVGVNWWGLYVLAPVHRSATTFKPLTGEADDIDQGSSAASQWKTPGSWHSHRQEAAISLFISLWVWKQQAHFQKVSTLSSDISLN